ncbi:MAG: hypothetical protein E5X35_07500 [Mesorhizobium sp.]|uniref:hypothetical protein n=1 Tax=Mesorhizobium sp. TaxID=1871066 RepID=UPI001213CAF3|nr:hypothetical protein [Mesorhizobium sp.]TIR34550.1 MAG: hypothetical protein E5X35_07500 [Mesorhizobium sp.]
MPVPVEFPGCNMLLRAPEGAENVRDMHTFTNGHCSVSCWEFDDDEIAEIVRTRRVYTSVLSGRTQPPIFLAPESVMRGFLVDYGGTWRVER